MHANSHVDRTVADAVVDEPRIGLRETLGIVAPRSQRLYHPGVAKEREVHLVELHVAAAGRRQRRDLGPVGGREVGEEPVEIGIDVGVDRGAPSAIVREGR